MFRNILGTFSTKVLSAALNFGVLILTTQQFGAAGRGQISLLLTNVAFNLLACHLVSGTALIYLAPKKPNAHLLALAYGWALLFCFAVTGGLTALGQAQPGWEGHLLALSLLQGVLSANTLLLVGREQIRAQNGLLLAQTVLTLAALAALLTVEAGPVAYVYALYPAFGLPWLLSFYWVLPLLRPFSLRNLTATWRPVWRLGATAQVSNVLQFFNYRLDYYFLNAFGTSQALGLYGTAVQLSEAIWIIARSVTLVQYARLVNQADEAYAARVTFRLTRLSGWTSLLAVLTLAVLPAATFEVVFGPEFGQLRRPLLALGPGIVAIGATMPFSNFFSSRGEFHVNNIGTALALGVTLAAGLALVPTYGATGAAVASSLSYLTLAAYLTYRFRRVTGFAPRYWLPQPEDWRLVRELLGRSRTGGLPAEKSKGQQEPEGADSG